MFYDDVEPKVLISMPVVEDLAPQTQSHAGRQERVKVELSHSVLPILFLDLLSSTSLRLDGISAHGHSLYNNAINLLLKSRFQ